jgi:cystathionine gamma-synthase
MERNPETAIVQGGRPQGPGAMLNVPIVANSTFRTGGDLSYGRSGNASWQALEAVIGELEGGEAVAFASGIAAVTAVLDRIPTGGIVVTSKPIYMGSWGQLEERAAGGRIAVRYVDCTDTDAVIAAADGAALIWLETPSNPMLAIADIAGIAAGRSAGTLLAVDGTFTSPLLQRPLALGADLVVHSATKLIGGHADLLLGVAVAAPELASQLRDHRSAYGATPGALEAFLALRGVRTLAVRLERAQANAQLLAELLHEHPCVTRVFDPGLPDHPGHALAQSQMDGFGTIIAFEVVGPPETARALCEATRVFAHATSLGGVESLIEHRGAKEWEQQMGTPPGLIRMSVGIEHPDDLLADLRQAIDTACSG